MSDEPIKFIFKPTKRILSNFFEPFKKKISKAGKVENEENELAKRYCVIGNRHSAKPERKFKVHFEPNLPKPTPKSWSGDLFAPLNYSMTGEENEEELFLLEPESPELDRYVENFTCLPLCSETAGGDFEESSNNPEFHTEPLPNAAIRKQYGSQPAAKPFTGKRIPSNEIITLSSDEEDVQLESAIHYHETPIKSYLDQRFSDSNFSVGDDLAKKLFGSVSEREVKNIAPFDGSSTIIIDDSSDEEAPTTNVNDPILEQLRNQFKPKEKIVKKRTKKADSSASGPSTGKPFKRRYRGGWKKKR